MSLCCSPSLARAWPNASRVALPILRDEVSVVLLVPAIGGPSRGGARILPGHCLPRPNRRQGDRRPAPLSPLRERGRRGGEKKYCVLSTEYSGRPPHPLPLLHQRERGESGAQKNTR